MNDSPISRERAASDRAQPCRIELDRRQSSSPGFVVDPPLGNGLQPFEDVVLGVFERLAGSRLDEHREAELGVILGRVELRGTVHRPPQQSPVLPQSGGQGLEDHLLGEPRRTSQTRVRPVGPWSSMAWTTRGAEGSTVPSARGGGTGAGAQSPK